MALARLFESEDFGGRWTDTPIGDRRGCECSLELNIELEIMQTLSKNPCALFRQTADPDQDLLDEALQLLEDFRLVGPSRVKTRSVDSIDVLRFAEPVFAEVVDLDSPLI